MKESRPSRVPRGVDVAAEVVEGGEQALAAGEAGAGDPLGEGHARQLGAVGGERGVGQAEVAGDARVAPGGVDRLGGQADEGRDGRVGRAGDLRDHRAEAGTAAVELALVAGVAGQADRGVVLVAAVGDRADQGDFVHDPREPGQVFADRDARQGRRDRAELAADLRGGIRLGVEGLELARAAGQEDHDDRLVRRFRPRLPRRFVFGPQKLRQAEPAHRQAADPEHVATGQAVAGPAVRPAFEVQHRGPSDD